MNRDYTVLLLAGCLFFWALGGHDLWAPDEPYFAEGAREAVVDGQWAVPHVNGKITTDKPPLFFWLIALFSLPLGEVSSFTARLPSALAALGTVALTMRLGRRFFEPGTGVLAGFVLSTTYLFWEKARWSQTDSLLCFLIWAALSAFAAFRAGEARGFRAGLLFWLALALAVLDKGPVGLLLPLGIALSVLAIDGELARWRAFAPLVGPLLFALVISTWIVIATIGSGGEYSVVGALRDHFVERGIHGLHHEQPFWYFAETLPPNLLPWTGLIPGALVFAWRRRAAADRFLLVTAVFVIIFFSISTEKRELYALPSLPAFSLMVAALVASVCGWEKQSAGHVSAPDRRWVTIGQAITGGAFVLAGLGLPFLAQRSEEVPAGALWAAWMMGGILFAGGLTALIAALRRKPFATAVAPALATSAIYILLVTVIYPTFEPRKSARPLAEKLAEVTAEYRSNGGKVVAYALENVPESLAFYSGGLYTIETDDAAVLIRHLAGPDPKWAVVDGAKLDPVPVELRNRLRVAEKTHLSRQPIFIVTNQPYPGGPLLSEVMD